MKVQKILFLALFVIASAGAQNMAGAAAPTPLKLEERQRYYVPRKELLMVLIDIYPQHEQLEGLDPNVRVATLSATALAQATELVTKPGLGDITTVRVEFSYIKNLDEYARRDYSSMVRQGYVLLKRETGQPFTVADTKLDFKP